jgi:hypothetical protein
MKQAYGQYIYPPKQSLEMMVKLTFNEMFDKIKADINCEDAECLKKTVFTFNATQIEHAALTGECLHYFFTGSGMHNWLLNCAAPLSKEQSEIISISRSNSSHSSPFMLHFQGGGSPVYLCQFNIKNIMVDVTPIVVNDDKIYLYILKGKYHPVIWSSIGGESSNDPEINRCKAVVSSALAYIQCFPDMVKNGIPDDLKHENYYRKSICKSIGMHHSLIEHAGPCPHYRIGHFRLLSSDKFVHKKGQVIFVHGTFVKGKALTVLSPEEVAV